MLGFRTAAVLALAIFASLPSSLLALDAERIPLRMLYLSRSNDDGRTKSFSEFLKENFASCRVEEREKFRREFLTDIDVVILDWSQSERQSGDEPSPIGRLEDWKHPLVLLGSAGLLLSKRWQIIGDAG